MELGPAAGRGGTVAECRCPPGTVQSPRDALCHKIYTRASCSKGQFFAPVPKTSGKSRYYDTTNLTDLLTNIKSFPLNLLYFLIKVGCLS